MPFISFNELCIILVIALIVLGPQKTFAATFAAGKLFARAKKYAVNLKNELGIDKIDEVKAVYKENDFSQSVKYSSPVRKVHTDKKMWTVSKEDFALNTEKGDSALSNGSTLENRILRLEKEIELLKSRLTGDKS